MGKTTELRRELKRVFIPHVVKAGFIVDHKYAPKSLDFRRVRGDELHVFDIQWEKYGSRRFFIDFGKCPASGVTFLGEHFPPDQIDAAKCESRGRLQPRKGPGPSNWFRQDKPILRALLSWERLYPAERVIAELLTLFTELEDYWSFGTIGPHLNMLPAIRPRHAV